MPTKLDLITVRRSSQKLTVKSIADMIIRIFIENYTRTKRHGIVNVKGRVMIGYVV